MKHIQLCLRLLAVLAIITTSCSSGSESVASDPTAVPATEVPFAPTPVPAATPTQEPAAVIVSDQDRIDAALASLEAAPGADMIAYDVLDTSVDGDNVTVTVCGWTGDSVFDSIYEALYATTADANGVVSAAEINTPRGAGECLNTTLIDTAIDTINEFEPYWKDVLRNPETFATEPRRETLLDQRTAEALMTITNDFVRDDAYSVGEQLDGVQADNLLAPMLWRRFDGAADGRLELVVCRVMHQEYGIYRDGVLLDDLRSPDSPGIHAVSAYVFESVENTTGLWQIVETEYLNWSDCQVSSGGWVSGANGWRPADTPLQERPG